MKKQYKMQSEVWLYPAETAAWHFVTIDKKVSEEIKEKHTRPRRGFGSVRVRVTVGKTSWKTSIFPDSKYGAYVLPLKADVRKKEGIVAGDKISFSVRLM